MDLKKLRTPPELLLAVDPGKSTGWAVFKHGLVYEMGIARSVDEFDDWLHKFEKEYGIPDTVVIEDFTLFRNKAIEQSGSRMEASQVIGITKSFGRRHEAKVQLQPAAILPMAVIYTKAKLPGNHKNSHHISAYNHGFYYLVKNHFVYPVGAEVKNDQSE
jgi:hypothetical protein